MALPVFFPEAAHVGLFGDRGLLMVDILHPDAEAVWDGTVRNLYEQGYSIETEPCAVHGRVEAYRLTRR